MKITLQIQLLPNTPQATALQDTLERFNEAATWLAGVAFAQQCAKKVELQKRTYYELRARFGLPADTAIRSRSQAKFSCKQCGYTTNADVNAALNIRYRALVNAPEVAGRCPQQLWLLARAQSVDAAGHEGAGASDKLPA